MPIINFSAADVLRGKLLEKGWYSFQVARLEGPTASKDKGSMNYAFILALIDKGPDLNGKEITARYNSKAMSMLIPFYAACKGLVLSDIKPESFSVDLEELVGCKVDGSVIVDTYEGQLKNDFETFLPYKKSQDRAQWAG